MSFSRRESLVQHRPGSEVVTDELCGMIRGKHISELSLQHSASGQLESLRAPGRKVLGGNAHRVDSTPAGGAAPEASKGGVKEAPEQRPGCKCPEGSTKHRGANCLFIPESWTQMRNNQCAVQRRTKSVWGLGLCIY